MRQTLCWEIIHDVDLVVYRLDRTTSQTTATKLDKETFTILREELGQEVRW